MSGEQVTFGRFRFDLGRRELSRDGIPVRLGNRALDVLCVLAAARGDVVTKDELLARVWPGQESRTSLPVPCRFVSSLR
jgi:DNA-binding winged helix-turn-helix (wHTH) protein